MPTMPALPYCVLVFDVPHAAAFSALATAVPSATLMPVERRTALAPAAAARLKEVLTGGIQSLGVVGYVRDRCIAAKGRTRHERAIRNLRRGTTRLENSAEYSCIAAGNTNCTTQQCFLPQANCTNVLIKVQQVQPTPSTPCSSTASSTVICPLPQALTSSTAPSASA